MDLLPPLGTQIDEVFAPTHKIYGELLNHNAKAIKSTAVQSFSYGSHPRQRLDVYYPSPSSNTSSSKEPAGKNNKGNNPVLIFLHGGGMYGGDKVLTSIPNGLAHANIGHFFAANYGYTVVVPNYRLVFQDAAFPSGGEDVSLILEWVYANMEPISASKNRHLILMGHSAGGIHQNTYLFAPQFAAHRARTIYSSPSNSEPPTVALSKNSTSTCTSTSTSTSALVLRTMVNLCVPFDIKPNGLFRQNVIDTYYGLTDLTPTHNPHNPLSLLKSANPSELKTLLSQVRILITTAEYDPPAFVIDANNEFFDVMSGYTQYLELEPESKPGSVGQYEGGVVRREIFPGHNHISPPVSLGTGIDREEEWGHKVAELIGGVLRAS